MLWFWIKAGQFSEVLNNLCDFACQDLIKLTDEFKSPALIPPLF